MNSVVHMALIVMNDLPSKRRPIVEFMVRAIRSWRARHRHGFNFWIHMAGIPLAGVGVLLLLVSPLYGIIPLSAGIGALIAGYFLQYVGHRVEGNDVGEWAAIKKLFGLPCNSIAQRWLPNGQETSERARN